MIRTLAAILFLAAILGVSAECEAQGLRGLFRRQARVQTAPIQRNVFQQDDYQAAQMHQPQWAGANTLSSRPLSNYRNPMVSRILDGPTNPYGRNPAEVNSRYIGGFHQSHFSNIGIPSGDVGIRGNAYNWNTW